MRCCQRIVYLERDDIFMIKCGCGVRAFKMSLPEIVDLGGGVFKYDSK